tara:strand:- start:174 stop:605 length:432 start_codon:yes stop_codon:yes gene_type:complete
MAQKRKSLKKSFRKNIRSTRRKSKTNKRKSRRRGGNFWSSGPVEHVSITFNKEIDELNSDLYENPPTNDIQKIDAQKKVKALIYYFKQKKVPKCELECQKTIVKGFEKLRDELVKKVFTTQDEIDTYRREANDNANFAINPPK